MNYKKIKTLASVSLILPVLFSLIFPVGVFADEGGYTPPVYGHTCALPGSSGDETVETVKLGNDGVSLQDFFIAQGIDKDVITDQKQYQLWDTPSATTTINIEFVGRNALYNSVFGFYKNGDISSFSPVFRSGEVPGFASTTEFYAGQSVAINITSADNIGFAIKTDQGTTYATLNSVNEGGNDHAVVYELGSNIYLISFEDMILESSDKDYNDIIVKMVVSGCQNTPDTLGTPEPPATDLSCKITSPDQTGWYGTYYNYKSDDLGMNLPTDEWGTKYGDPLSIGSSWGATWYNDEFARFSRIDDNLTFGSKFFPFDTASEEINNGHDYHFGAHWQAKVVASTTGAFEFTLRSDDDAWIYMDGNLVVDNSGIHSAQTANGSVSLIAGEENTIDIFFAERHTTESEMSFAFNSADITIKPYSPLCPPPAPEAPVISLTAEPQTIDLGATSTLSWLSQNTTSCSALWTPATSTSGSQIVSPAATTEYTIACTGAGGNALATTSVTVLAGTTTPPVNTPPTITLVGDNPFNLTVDTLFIDPGATATDLEDGDATTTSHIIVSGAVNASTTGTYVLTYSVTDSGGLGATTTRTVIVNATTTPPVVNPPTDNGGGGGGGGGIGGRRHDISNLLATGEILGATSCFYLRDYLKIDWQNDKIEVLKLQSFLNVFEGESLSLTGVFDEATFKAVERFQMKYSGDILEPWGDKVTTGFVYILTKKKINEIYCDTVYPLSQTDQDEINTFKSSSGGASGVTGFLQGTNDGQGVLSGISIDTSPVVELEGGAKEKKDSSSGSVVRNAAVSLFALPQKIFDGGFGNRSYTLILLILILAAVAIAVIRSFIGSDDSDSIPKPPVPPVTPITEKDEEDESPDESPVIILPGTLPDEEIVVENPEEDEEETIDTPDLRS